MTQPVVNSRHTVDSLTDDELTRLYDELERVKSRKAALMRAHVALATQAGKDQAALNAARALATNMRDWDGDHPAINRWATDLLAALDAPTEQPGT